MEPQEPPIPDSSVTEVVQAKISTATWRPEEEAGGATIGSYKLLQLLGKGGMGEVWLAEQKNPVSRRVALKIIKADLRGDQVLARFDAERQALALMEHPNIAKVLDAGTTATGRSYFVMELVKGIPFTEYCDQERLQPRQRLELFIPICHAVHHAHQKGIIHRDLKPPNVLVANYDGKPVPKIIDFGIAKATHQKLTELTMYTEIGMMVGTLEYMAPEQAELNNLDIDQRADIYSLGVMLYESLTGALPFSAEQLRDEAFLEMLRLIRDEEPQRPSKKLSTSKDLASIATKRNLEPKKLMKLVRGDLDWIVMKCLEKERTRRYETANQLSEDLQRFLADQPVQAGPPSLSYRAKKFLHRHPELKIWGCVFAVLQLCIVTVATVIVFMGRPTLVDNRPEIQVPQNDNQTDLDKRPKRPPRLPIKDLHVFAVGISDYEHKKRRTGGATPSVNDARCIVEALKKLSAEMPFGEVEGTCLLDEYASRAKIQDGLQKFLGQPKSNSLAVIFFSGVALIDPETNAYCFAPHDYVFDAPKETTHSIEKRTITFQYLQKYAMILPCPVIIILDTSHSGAALLEKHNNNKLVVMAACGPGEKAPGRLDWGDGGHAALSLALLEGLDGKHHYEGIKSPTELPSPDKNGIITLDEMNRYVTDRVKALTEEDGYPDYFQNPKTTIDGELSLEQIPISFRSIDRRK